MAKPKKLTYNELANYIIMTENKLTNAINVVGTTLTDFIEFNKKDDSFKKYLKKKYGKKEEE
jgi:hypothetical protein